jgi:4-amino-4-deoxy-L-arabinose transferase-like glycosyltransferase
VSRLLPYEPGGVRHPLVLALLRTAVTVVALLALYFLLPLDRGFSAGTLGALVIGVVAMGLLVAWQVRSILRSRHPAVRAVEAIALSLPLFLLLFAATYFILAGSQAAAFTEPLSKVDSLYFVVTVFATVGFGDIAPVTELARVLVTLQMVGDLVLIGLVLRLFLTAVDRGRQRVSQQQGSPPLTPGG